MLDEQTIFSFTFKADTKQMRNELKAVSKEAKAFQVNVDTAFAGVINKTKTLEQGFKDLALQVSLAAYKEALKPVDNFIGGVAASAGGLFGNLIGFAKGGVIGGGAGSGELNAPIAFPLGGTITGIAGEAGAEAILPLRRGANGELGISASGGSNAPIINVNINATDIESFRRSEAEIGASLNRIVSRSNRSL